MFTTDHHVPGEVVVHELLVVNHDLPEGVDVTLVHDDAVLVLDQLVLDAQQVVSRLPRRLLSRQSVRLRVVPSRAHRLHQTQVRFRHLKWKVHPK